MVKAKNEQNYIDERRHAKQLKVTASAIMVLGVWTVIKALLVVYTGDDFKEIRELDNSVAGLIVKTIVLFVFVVVFVVVVLSMRFIILKGAYREAERRIAKNGYLVCAVILMMVGLLSVGSFIYTAIKDIRSIELTYIASLAMDITSFVMLLEMFVSAIRLRKSREQIKEAEGGNCS